MEWFNLISITEALKEGTQKLKIDGTNPWPRLDSEVLLKHLLKVDRSYFLINGDKILQENVYDEFQENILRRLNGEPVAYIIKEQEFMGLPFYVDERVLIPRPDTEILVEFVIEKCKGSNQTQLQILDMCAGSGAIGLSLAKYIPWSNVFLSDISKGALEVCEYNKKKLGLSNVELVQSDCFDNINNKFNIIISNPPYIPSEQILYLQKSVCGYEPGLALDGGKDGLNFYRIIVKEARKYLLSQGIIALEIGYDQGEKVADLLKKEGYSNITIRKDLAGHNRVVTAE